MLLFQHGDSRLQEFFLGGRYPTAADLDALLAVLPGRGDPPATLASLRESLPGVAASKLRVLLTMLKERRVVTERRGAGFRRRTRSAPERIAALVRAYEHAPRSDRAKLDAMMIYAQTALCRWKPLLESLGETVEWERVRPLRQLQGHGGARQRRRRVTDRERQTCSLLSGPESA